MQRQMCLCETKQIIHWDKYKRNPEFGTVKQWFQPTILFYLFYKLTKRLTEFLCVPCVKVLTNCTCATYLTQVDREHCVFHV